MSKAEVVGSFCRWLKRSLTKVFPFSATSGMLPESQEEGGYGLNKGKNSTAGGRLMEDALALDRAGVLRWVLGVVSAPVAESISPKAGADDRNSPAEGLRQVVLVTYDLLGMFPGSTALRPTQGESGDAVQSAVAEFVGVPGRK